MIDRELERRELIGLGVVVGASALVGSLALALGGDDELLEEIPFDSHAHQLVHGLVAFVTLVLGWRLLRAHAEEGRTTT